MSESEMSHQSQRGYNADGVWYHSVPSPGDQEAVNEEVAAQALEQAGIVLQEVRSVLSEVRSLVHAVQVSSVVLEDVQELCRGCEAALEAFISTRDYLSGRARASERRRARHSSGGGPIQN